MFYSEYNYIVGIFIIIAILLLILFIYRLITEKKLPIIIIHIYTIILILHFILVFLFTSVPNPLLFNHPQPFLERLIIDVSRIIFSPLLILPIIVFYLIYGVIKLTKKRK